MTDAKQAAWRRLCRYAATARSRDRLVLEALAAGITKQQIFLLTGIARSTIDRIAATPDPVPVSVVSGEDLIGEWRRRLDLWCADLESHGIAVERDGFKFKINLPSA